MLDINGTIVVQIINFLLMVVILSFVAYKPIMKMMQERSDKIANDLDNAEKERAIAEELKLDYQRQLNDARKQAQLILDKAVQQAESAKDDVLNITRAENAKLLKQVQEEIAREREKMFLEVRSQIVSLSIECAAKVLAREVNKADNERLISDYVSKLTFDSAGEKHVN
ncbi:MAG: F0F1 ATP synthase subunit B [Negativicutes bacterium]